MLRAVRQREHDCVGGIGVAEDDDALVADRLLDQIAGQRRAALHQLNQIPRGADAD